MALGVCPSTALLQDVEPGGSANFLFMLTVEHKASSQAVHKGLTGALGKLEVRWRSSSAALGRLQTQQIMASSAAQKDVALTLCSLPQACSAHAVRTTISHPVCCKKYISCAGVLQTLAPGQHALQ